MVWIQWRLDGTSCVGQLRARRPSRRRLRDRRLAPTALKMPPLPGLRTTYLAPTAVKRAGVAAISNVQQRTITEEQWLLSPGGATSLMPWAQAHGYQAAVAPAASSWLTKDDNSYRAATGEPSIAWIQRRLDGTSCAGELRARRPSRRPLGPVGLRPRHSRCRPYRG